jgi:hypothetical protein
MDRNLTSKHVDNTYKSITFVGEGISIACQAIKLVASLPTFPLLAESSQKNVSLIKSQKNKMPEFSARCCARTVAACAQLG